MCLSRTERRLLHLGLMAAASEAAVRGGQTRRCPGRDTVRGRVCSENSGCQVGGNERQEDGVRTWGRGIPPTWRRRLSPTVSGEESRVGIRGRLGKDRENGHAGGLTLMSPEGTKYSRTYAQTGQSAGPGLRKTLRGTWPFPSVCGSHPKKKADSSLRTYPCIYDFLAEFTQWVTPTSTFWRELVKSDLLEEKP